MISLHIQVKSSVLTIVMAIGGDVPKLMESTVRVAQNLGRNTAKLKYLSGPRPERLGVITGRLRNSIAAPPPIRSSRGDVVGYVGTNVVYARIHEFGGEIKPKNAQWLTIPVNPTIKGRARDYQDTYIAPLKSGGFAIFQAERSGTTQTGQHPIFWLARKVKIPARPFLHPALLDSRPAIQVLFSQQIQMIVNQAIKKHSGGR